VPLVPPPSLPLGVPRWCAATAPGVARGTLSLATTRVVLLLCTAAGWQRNVDQYFEEEVRYIYDTVVSSLLRDSKRKFIFVETAYVQPITVLTVPAVLTVGRADAC